jgi:hypothetical protein
MMAEQPFTRSSIVLSGPLQSCCGSSLCAAAGSTVPAPMSTTEIVAAIGSKDRHGGKASLLGGGSSDIESLSSALPRFPTFNSQL